MLKVNPDGSVDVSTGSVTLGTLPREQAAQFAVLILAIQAGIVTTNAAPPPLIAGGNGDGTLNASNAPDA